LRVAMHSPHRRVMCGLGRYFTIYG
jgi:hypothetical protein